MDWRSLESRPGSFSKNFGWNARPGLQLLHEVINAVFTNGLEPVKRDAARTTISAGFSGDPLVPLNFFLYNQVIDGQDYIVPDQLVIQALAEDHSTSFDYLAISALNFSRVGRWSDAKPFQSHPAPWARSFVVDVLYDGNRWNPDKVQADTIQNFLDERLVHRGNNTRKFATNLNFLYRHSGMLSLRSSETEDWWGAALFLFLDRSAMDGEVDHNQPTEDILVFLDSEKFWALTAVDSTSARFAAAAIIDEYREMGGLERLQPATPLGEGLPTSSSTTTASVSKRTAAQIRQPHNLSLSPVQRVFVQAQRQVRNRTQVEFLKALYEDECAVCGTKLQVDSHKTTYSEAGHIKPIGDPIKGPDHISNILLFCPNHHKAFDRGGVWLDVDSSSAKVRSVTSDQSFDMRSLEIHEHHTFDFQYAEWHARYFGHI